MPLDVLVIGWSDAGQCRALCDAAPPGTHFSFVRRDAPDLVQELERADVIIAGALPGELARHAERALLVQVDGAGYEDVALDALPDTTAVANVFEHGAAIAEYVFFGAIAVLRRLRVTEAAFRRGDWSWSWAGASGAAPGAELRGKTMAVLGLGTIGSEVARLATCFGMHVIGITPHPGHHSELRRVLEKLDGLAALPNALAASSIVVIALPLTNETLGLLGGKELALMPKDSIVVNVGRAEIIDEHALYTRLRDGLLGGAVLDVWYRYPTGSEQVAPAHYPFHELDNVVMTPHVSAWTREVFDARARVIGEQLWRLLRREPLVNVIRAARAHAAGQTG